MAALKENLTGANQKSLYTSTKRKEHCIKLSDNRQMASQLEHSTVYRDRHLEAVHLHQRWHELMERERKAQQHNRQLLQEFEKAQETLREMVASTAAMKTIRIEFERYLEESAPCWQQQLKEKTQAALRKRMEECLQECLRNAEVKKSSAEEQPTPSRGPTKKLQKAAAPQEYNNQNSHADYNQDASPHARIPSMHSSWLTLTKSQMANFPSRLPCQSHGSSFIPPSFHPPSIYPNASHPFQFHHLASTAGHCQEGPLGWTSHQTEYPWSAGVAGYPSGPEGLWGQLSMTEPAGCGAVQEASQTSTAQNPREGGCNGNGSSHSCCELDVKPVRLTAGHAESSDSSRVSSRASREERKKRGRAQQSSSHRETCSSQGSSRTSSVTRGSESTERQVKETIKERSCRERDSESISIKLENGGADETEEQESSSSEHSSAGGEDDEEEECEKKLGDGDDDGEVQEKEAREENRVGQDDDDYDDASARNSTENEEETVEEDELEEQESEGQGGDEQSNREKRGNGESGKQTSESSLDEEEDEDRSGGSEDKTEEDEEQSAEEDKGGLEEGEQRNDEAGKLEESDSDDIISPQQNRCKTIHVIPEEEEEVEDDGSKEGSRTGQSDVSNEFSDEDDVERLLAPQTQTKGEEDVKGDDKPEASCAELQCFPVEQNRGTDKDQDTDSDEFDHFYD